MENLTNEQLRLLSTQALNNLLDLIRIAINSQNAPVSDVRALWSRVESILAERNNIFNR